MSAGAFDWTGTLAPWGEQGTPRLDEDGRVVVGIATCGACGRSWNDELSTSRTPAPSARCPFEGDHDYADQVGELEAARRALERAEETLRQAWEAGAPPDVVKALESGREDVRAEYHDTWRAVAHQREHEAISRAAHVDLNTPRAAEVRAFLTGRYGDMVTDDMVRSVVAGLEEEG